MRGLNRQPQVLGGGLVRGWRGGLDVFVPAGIRPILAGTARRYGALGQTAQFVIVSIAVSVIVAGAVTWRIDSVINQILLEVASSRAMDQVQLGIRDHVTAADFEPPYTQARLDEVSARLSPILARARQRGSGVLRVNLFARDGTIIYSDMANLRGRVVSPVDDVPLAQALAGSFGAEVSALAGAENVGLTPFGDSVLEAYVPFRLNGAVVGAYELYTDAGPARLWLWCTVGCGFGLVVLVVMAAAALERSRLRPTHKHRHPASPAHAQHAAPQPGLQPDQARAGSTAPDGDQPLVRSDRN